MHSEWHEIQLKDASFKILSQVSSRIFLGLDLCRNDKWLQVTVDYTRTAMLATQNLLLWPRCLRHIVYWFSPYCRAVREQLRMAKVLVNPILTQRRREGEKRQKLGLAPIRHLDSIQWLEDAANGRPYDPAASQVMLAIAANFTGSDMLGSVLLNLCEHPDLVNDLRKEIIEVIGNTQWSKSSLYKLRLMDSVMKETQRLKPSAIGK